MSVMGEVDQAASAVTVRVPLAIKNRGGRKVVVSPDGQPISATSRPRVDNTLMRAVVQAFHWKSLMEAGQFATVSELAATEGLNGSYVAHVLRLTLLAPDLVEAVLEEASPKRCSFRPSFEPSLISGMINGYRSLERQLLTDCVEKVQVEAALKR
jgi:hypothetical protein